MTTIEKLEDLIYRGFKETDRQFKETDRKIKETSEQLKETDRKLQELAKHVNGITDSLGLFAENMVKPAAARIFAERGITLTGFTSRSSQQLDGHTMEVDILGYGPEHVIAIEVKLKLRQADVNETVKKLLRFFDSFERFRGLTLYGAVAGMSIAPGVDTYAYKKGLFVLAQSGENVHLLNDEKFVPRAFKFAE